MKKIIVILAVCLSVLCVTACGRNNAESIENTEIYVFAAASLQNAMNEVAEEFNKDYPNVHININADSSGTLLTQIREGAECDIFFPASTLQANELIKDGVVANTENVLNNTLVVVSRKNSDTAVTGLSDIGKAKSIALAGQSVPAGQYTRQALINSGVLSSDKKAEDYTAAEVSEALGGVEISEQSNVSKVLIAVAEGACDVGTVYFSDTYGYEDKIDVLEEVPKELTGDIIYPICRIDNEEASDEQVKAAVQFYDFAAQHCGHIFSRYDFESIN